MTLLPESRSTSPEIRGLRLFRAISKKLGRRTRENVSNNNRVEADDTESRSSSSSDSCSSTSAGHCSKKINRCSSEDSGFKSSLRHISSSSSEAGSDVQTVRQRYFSASAETVRKAFQNIAINAQHSQSCSSPKEHKRKSKKPVKKILRSPTTYTYVKGLSGLPTRIPTYRRVYLNNSCSCNIQYTVKMRQ